MTKSVFDSSELYDRYALTIVVRERLDGGVPKDRDLIHQWVAAKTGHDDAETQKIVDEHMPDVAKATEAAAADKAESMWCGFKQDANDPEGRHYVETRQVKALLRECAVVLGITKKKRGSRNLIQHAFEVKAPDGGSKIRFKTMNGGTEEGAIHVMTPQGPRSALKRVDYTGEGTVLKFEIWVLGTQPAESRHLGQAEIEEMLKLAQENGLGANRSQGSGKFDVIEFSKIADGKGSKSASAKAKSKSGTHEEERE
jgi:hypothetical protein